MMENICQNCEETGWEKKVEIREPGDIRRKVERRECDV